ncbi:hypothetical protein FQR65_LT07803 [Abscondita terminalis]|nr:hypothetical protein FQR65_LT07803 [Abscondita terminalis]
MAVFFKNDCKYNGCGKSFSTLSSLIEHIEGAHLDFDPKVLAGFEVQRPSALPLSYILKYSQCKFGKTSSVDVRMRLLQHASKSSLEKLNEYSRYKFSPASSVDEAEIISETESSNDSWTPTKGISFKYVLYADHHFLTNAYKKTPKHLPYKEKPYGCSVPGCKKRYKNINGIKYHCKHGHKHFEKLKKVNKKSKIINNGKIISRKADYNGSVQFPSTSSSMSFFSESSTVSHRRGTTENPKNCTIDNVKIESQLYSDNSNMYYPVDFTLSCQNDYNKMERVNGVTGNNDLTIIRSNLKNTESF